MTLRERLGRWLLRCDEAERLHNFVIAARRARCDRIGVDIFASPLDILEIAGRRLLKARRQYDEYQGSDLWGVGCKRSLAEKDWWLALEMATQMEDGDHDAS